LDTFLRRQKHSPDVNADRFGTYLKPGKCNLTALDSLFVMKSPGTEDAMVVFFQMTIGLSHPLKASWTTCGRHCRREQRRRHRLWCLSFRQRTSTSLNRSRSHLKRRQGYSESGRNIDVLAFNQQELWKL
jgi:hypothetical protein